MELEAGDEGFVSERSESQAPVKSEQSDRAKTPTPRETLTKDSASPVSASELKPLPNARPLSKLAALAQQKAGVGNKPSGSLSFDIPSASQTSVPSRPLSKLALLAQQKVDASRVPKLPKTTTEYLTPIANGSSVTTAITTSYQSLYSLTDPSRSSVIPKLDVVPLQFNAPETTTSPSDKKPSKLAMKIKRATEKAPQSPGFPSEEELASSISPIFQPKASHARASPSAFASVLMNDNSTLSEDKRREKDVKLKKKEKKEKKENPTKNPSKQSSDNASTQVFTFDRPSPDDIVLNARKKPKINSKAMTASSPATGSGRI